MTNIEFKNYDWLNQKYSVERLPTTQIAHLANVSYQSINRWLRKFNIPIRNKFEYHLDKKFLEFKNKTWLKEKYLNEQLSALEISKKVGVHFTTVLEWLDFFEIKKRTMQEAQFLASQKFKSKEKCHLWKGGIDPLYHQIRNCSKYVNWRKSIFKRDNFTCQICFKYGAKLCVDHINPFAIIINKNDITNFENALICDELWDLNNGRTLCKNCHEKTETYGINTKKILDLIRGNND